MTEAGFQNFKIRPARISDAPGIHHSHMRSIQIVCGPDYSTQQIGAWGGRPFDQEARAHAILRNYVWVVERDQRIYGFVELRVDPEAPIKAEILALYLSPEAKGIGLGSHLLVVAEQKCMALGAMVLILGSSRTAQKFYESHGFIAKGGELTLSINGVPIPYTPMQKQLGPSLTTQPMERKQFQPEHLGSILKFCSNHVSSDHSLLSLRRFMTDLSGGSDCIFEGWSVSRRTVIAILVTPCTNPSNTGEILIGGSDKKIDEEQMELIFKILEAKAFAVGLYGVDFGLNSKTPVSETFLKNRNYGLSFATYTMQLEIGSGKVSNSPNSDLICQSLTDSYFDEYYQVLVETFKNNPETSVSPYESSKQNWKARAIPPQILLFNKNVVGFISVSGDSHNKQRGEILTMGVLPKFRGRRFGQVLMEHGIGLLKLHNIKQISLSVETNNSRAISIYQTLGFEVVECCQTFRFDFEGGSLGPNSAVLIADSR